MPRVTVIIPNYNGKNLINLPLESLKEQEFKDFEIVVVDNGSEDGSRDFILSKYPHVKVISLNKNYGFSFAVNRGIQSTESEYVALLNNDVRVDKRWLFEMVKALDERTHAFSCNPKVLRLEEPWKINVLGIRYNSDGEALQIGDGTDDVNLGEKLRYVFGVNAAASLYRRSLFLEAGLFDETFFATYEDVDMSFRSQLMGFQSIHCPRSVAYHKVSQTIKRRRYYFGYLRNRNSLLCALKNMPDELLRRNFLKIVGRRAKAILRRSLMSPHKIRTYFFICGIFSVLPLVPMVLKKRRKIQRLRKVSEDYIASIMDRDFLDDGMGTE